ncbi:sugar phosphate isomerase/epimerase [Streptomyces sp. LX-29]|uniref:sugar phosphate isomerase/epimerase family protein n=1 Tax=Streptomyces sp. LX-29 TaxID=2900152 RepID=UPI00240E5CB7|nr:sugar phosphate isomerase/epimerase family protein [Streptomyces sp. LX-29]WFB09482.1 sugar phosphate isomerase/epimerase [Streptomyces sp. LX-29]
MSAEHPRPTPEGPGLPAGIRLCGIGDEAGASLDEQITALTTLGWDAIELRTVDGTAVADLDEAAFERVAERLTAARLEVACVDSRIANWARPVTAPFAQDLHELDVLVERCARLGTDRVRVMSYPNDGLPEDRWRAEALARLAALTARAEAAGLVLLHENCAGWAGTRADRMLDLLAHVDSPALRLLFDVGNGVAYGYRAYELLPRLTPYIAHVHIKDAVGTPEDTRYTLPGHGDCRVPEALRHLLDHGYTGVWSIEPHINVRPHDFLARSGDDVLSAFVDYGRELEKLIGGLGGLSGSAAAGGTGTASEVRS